MVVSGVLGPEAGMQRGRREAQRRAESCPRHRYLRRSFRRKPDLAESRESEVPAGGPGMETPGCPACCRPLLLDPSAT